MGHQKYIQVNSSAVTQDSADGNILIKDYKNSKYQEGASIVLGDNNDSLDLAYLNSSGQAKSRWQNFEEWWWCGNHLLFEEHAS